MSVLALNQVDLSVETLHLSGELPQGADDFGPSGGHRTQSVELAFVQANYSYDSELNLQAALHRFDDSAKSLERARLHRKWGKFASILARMDEAGDLAESYMRDVSADHLDADLDYAQDTVAYSRLVHLRDLDTTGVYGERRVLSIASGRPVAVLRLLLAHAQFIPTPTSVPGMAAAGSEATTQMPSRQF